MRLDSVRYNNYISCTYGSISFAIIGRWCHCIWLTSTGIMCQTLSNRYCSIDRLFEWVARRQLKIWFLFKQRWFQWCRLCFLSVQPVMEFYNVCHNHLLLFKSKSIRWTMINKLWYFYPGFETNVEVTRLNEQINKMDFEFYILLGACAGPKSIYLSNKMLVHLSTAYWFVFRRELQWAL